MEYPKKVKAMSVIQLTYLNTWRQLDSQIFLVSHKTQENGKRHIIKLYHYMETSLPKTFFPIVENGERVHYCGRHSAEIRRPLVFT